MRNELGQWEKRPDLLLDRNLERYAKKSSIARELQTALLAWSKQFNLMDDWILDAALHTLHQWANPFRLRDWDTLRQVPQDDGSYPLTIEEQEFRFIVDGWFPDVESWQGFEESVIKSFQEKIRDYEKRVKALVRTRGFVEGPQIRKPEIYQLLALYQSGGKTLRGISPTRKTTNRTPQGRSRSNRQADNTAFQAMKRAARLIGLTLRQKINMT